MQPTVRYDASQDRWWFGNEDRRSDGADSIVIKRGDLSIATATDLARALRRARKSDAEPDQIFIDLAPDDEYSPKESFVDAISFSLDGDERLAVEILLGSDRYFDNDDELHAVFEPVLAPYLGRTRSILRSLKADDYRSTAPYTHRVVISPQARGRTLAEVYAVAEGLAALFAVVDSGKPTRETVLGLIEGGRADLMIGQPENHWFEAKSDHYNLTTDRGKISLAHAVSRFCNSEVGGLIVVGLRTSHPSGGEVISAVRPVAVDAGTARRYRRIIESRVFPFPAGLRIDVVEYQTGSGLVTISIPPQEEELKPFLVHGAIVGDGVEGAFISIVRRSGEDSIPITAQQIHSSLAAGRALLRRGQLPPSR